MADLIYNFVRNVLIGQNSTITGANDLATMLTWTVMVVFFLLLCKLVVWCFNLGNNKQRLTYMTRKDR